MCCFIPEDGGGWGGELVSPPSASLPCGGGGRGKGVSGCALKFHVNRVPDLKGEVSGLPCIRRKHTT